MPSSLGEVRGKFSREADRPEGEGGARQEVDA